MIRKHGASLPKATKVYDTNKASPTLQLSSLLLQIKERKRKGGREGGIFLWGGEGRRLARPWQNLAGPCQGPWQTLTGPCQTLAGPWQDRLLGH